jgi:hypothetical protein
MKNIHLGLNTLINKDAFDLVYYCVLLLCLYRVTVGVDIGLDIV